MFRINNFNGPLTQRLSVNCTALSKRKKRFMNQPFLRTSDYALPCQSIGPLIHQSVGPSRIFLNCEGFLFITASFSTVCDCLAVYPALLSQGLWSRFMSKITAFVMGHCSLNSIALQRYTFYTRFSCSARSLDSQAHSLCQAKL